MEGKKKEKKKLKNYFANVFRGVSELPVVSNTLSASCKKEKDTQNQD